MYVIIVIFCFNIKLNIDLTEKSIDEVSVFELLCDDQEGGLFKSTDNGNRSLFLRGCSIVPVPCSITGPLLAFGHVPPFLSNSLDFL